MTFPLVNHGLFSGITAVMPNKREYVETGNNILKVVQLGSTSPDRRIIIVVQWANNVSLPLTAELGGVALTLAAQAVNAGDAGIAIYSIANTDDTLALLDITFGSNYDEFTLTVFAVYGLEGIVAIDSVTDNAPPCSGSLDCLAGGLVVAAVSTDASDHLSISGMPAGTSLSWESTPNGTHFVRCVIPDEDAVLALAADSDSEVLVAAAFK